MRIHVPYGAWLDVEDMSDPIRRVLLTALYLLLLR